MRIDHGERTQKRRGGRFRAAGPAVFWAAIVAALSAVADPGDAAGTGRPSPSPIVPLLVAQASAGPLAESPHPLAKVLSFAESRYQQFQAKVKDHTCVLIKRERIDGQLGDPQHLLIKVRSQQMRDGRVMVPFSVFVQWLAPEKYVGRRVLYVGGWNKGKMRVRRGGQRLEYLTVNISPLSELALSESQFPIFDAGIDRVAAEIMRQIKLDIQIDPYAENTQVKFFENARINERTCTRIEVVHPEKWPGMVFSRANVFVDNQLQIPIRIDAHDWPEEGEQPPLLAEYTYTQLRLNVGLTDEDFAPSVVHPESQEPAGNDAER